MSQEEDIRQVIRKEFVRCAKDPVHFMKKYCYIQHPQRGRILFSLYPFQEKTLLLMRDNPYSVVLKSRQLGISTLGAGYSLWLMMFHKDKNILCLATTQETARNMVTKVRFMYDNLPQWLRIDSMEDNKLSLRLTNGSQIKAKSSNADAARSEAVSLLLIDEAAFIDNIEEVWTSAQQTLATGGGCLALSTPNGMGNWFHKTWMNAELGENKFLPIKLPWFVHPERDQEWRDSQDKLLGDPKAAAQECDCDFASSGQGVFPVTQILEQEKEMAQDPVERRGIDKNLWVWEYPATATNYLISADVARGDGADYSAFHVLDIERCVQVAEYKGQIGTTEFAGLLHRIAMEYNNALLVVENASIGWAVVQNLLETGYPNLYHSPRGSDITAESFFNPYGSNDHMTPGFTNSSKTRPMLIGKYQEYFFDSGVTIRSKRLLDEMKVFIWKNGKAESQPGYNDDLVLSMGIALFIRDTATKFGKFGLEMQKSLISGMTNSRNLYDGVYNAGNTYTQNPYTQQINGEDHDLTWLL